MTINKLEWILSPLCLIYLTWEVGFLPQILIFHRKMKNYSGEIIFLQDILVFSKDFKKSLQDWCLPKDKYAPLRHDFILYFEIRLDFFDTLSYTYQLGDNKSKTLTTSGNMFYPFLNLMLIPHNLTYIMWRFIKQDFFFINISY